MQAEILKQDRAKMENLFGKKPKRKHHLGAITILLLGETGVGKSTWINEFANYLEYESLEMAMANPPICLIPTTFTISDSNGQRHTIKCGEEDENEDREGGHSATQYAQSYIFTFKDGASGKGTTIRLIDTPGIGDVRGLEQDKKNLANVLDHISHLDEIHMICFLLTSNNPRLGPTFTFCIKELHTHFHKDACRNIVFCFTNTMRTFFRPGETLNTLTELLKNDKILEMIPLEGSTNYCADSAAIRLLYAMRQGIYFSAEEKMMNKMSWDISASEIGRLVEHAKQQIPHTVHDTLTLNNARKIIFLLRSPIAEIARNIQINKTLSAERKEQLKKAKSKGNVEDLPIEQMDLIIIPLNAPRTICTADKCVEYINVGIYPKTHYKATCHDSCSRDKQRHFKIANKVGHPSLSKCSAFDSHGICKQCSCSWKHHMKITYETKAEVKIIPRSKDEMNDLNIIERELKVLEAHVEELKYEEEEFTKASATFAVFLNQNAITVYNNAKNKYLERMIDDEEKKTRTWRRF